MRYDHWTIKINNDIYKIYGNQFDFYSPFEQINVEINRTNSYLMFNGTLLNANQTIELWRVIEIKVMDCGVNDVSVIGGGL